MKTKLLIGVITSNCQTHTSAELLQGIIKQAFLCDSDIAVLAPSLLLQHCSNEHHCLEKNIYNLIMSNRFDGFIYDTHFISQNIEIKKYVETLLKQSQKPVMMVDGKEHSIFENTVADDASAFEQLVNHLIEVHNYKKIYCLTGPKKSFFASERLRGYFYAMDKHDLFYDESYYSYGDFHTQAATELGEKLINKQLRLPDAIVCGNNLSAATLIKKLSKGGIRVPQDVAVTGFDCTLHDIDTNHFITSYMRGNFRLGAECFRRLYHILTGTICKRIPNEQEGLHIGHSCGCYSFPQLKKPKTRTQIMQQAYDRNMLSGDMLIDTINITDLNTLLTKIADYTSMIYKFSKFSLHLTEEYLKTLTQTCPNELTFTKNQPMVQVLQKRASGETINMYETHEAYDILPYFSVPHKLPMAYYISPLCFNNNFFGYAALSFGKEALSYSNGYSQFILYTCTALEQHRISQKKQAFSDLYCYEPVTGLPILRMLEQQFFRNKPSHDIVLIFLEITDMKKLYGLNNADDFSKIIKFFAKNMFDCLQSEEQCGIISPGSFCIISNNQNRVNEIFKELKRKISSGHTTTGIHCPLSFSMGQCIGTITDRKSFYEMLHEAIINTTFTHTEDAQNINNPLFEKLCQLRDKMKKNPQLQWSIEQICNELHVSKSHLQKSYKSYFEKSIFEDLIDFRINMAKHLLENSTLSINDISMECGYSSYCHFTKQFKKIINISPTDYRKQLKDNPS